MQQPGIGKKLLNPTGKLPIFGGFVQDDKGYFHPEIRHLFPNQLRFGQGQLIRVQHEKCSRGLRVLQQL